MFDWCGNWNLPFTPEAEDLSPFSGGTALDLPWVEKKNFLIEPEVGVAVGAQQQMIVLCHKFEILFWKKTLEFAIFPPPDLWSTGCECPPIWCIHLAFSSGCPQQVGKWRLSWHLPSQQWTVQSSLKRPKSHQFEELFKFVFFDIREPLLLLPEMPATLMKGIFTPRPPLAPSLAKRLPIETLSPFFTRSTFLPSTYSWSWRGISSGGIFFGFSCNLRSLQSMTLDMRLYCTGKG